MLLPGLHKRGVATAASAVIGAEQPEPPCLGVLRASGVEVVVQRLAGRGYRSEILSHRRAIADFRANLIHTHGYRADVLGGMAAGGRLARMTTVHGFTGGDWKNRVYEWLQVRSYRRFDAVVPVSRLLHAQLERRGVNPQRLHLIPNAFEAPEGLSRKEARVALGLPQQATVIGWVGRLSPEKGPDVFLRAAAQLPDPEVRFALVGDGPQRGSLKVLADRLGIADRVDWSGLVPSAGRYYRAFDVFVLSSRTEGTPIALFEAMAAGVPIVATQVGGVPHVIDETTGCLVPSERPEALAEGVRGVLRERASANDRAARARQRLEREYALSPWIDRYCDLYVRLLA